MRLTILAVPWDSGHRAIRMGAGPLHLLEQGLARHLEERGHDVAVEEIAPDVGGMPAEVSTAFALQRRLAERVRAARDARRVPVVLAGNCNTAVGTVAGAGADETAVFWFDAHGDLNTPETTTGGFLDGMAVAILTGRCWRAIAGRTPGFAPVPDDHVVLLGARDLDPPERDLLDAAAITLAPPSSILETLDLVLARLRGRARGAYVHLDLDVLDAEYGKVNSYAAPGGPSPEEVASALRRIAAALPIRAITLSALDPAADPTGRAARHAVALLDALLDAAGAADADAPGSGGARIAPSAGAR
jgi:arginase